MEDFKHFIFGKAETYSSDILLFKQLGLNTFYSTTNDKLYVGEYKIPEHEFAKISIWVTCMPAQFWEFQIITEENKKIKIQTGSGALNNFWSSVMLVAQGMFEIEYL